MFSFTKSGFIMLPTVLWGPSSINHNSAPLSILLMPNLLKLPPRAQQATPQEIYDALFSLGATIVGNDQGHLSAPCLRIEHKDDNFSASYQFLSDKFLGWCPKCGKGSNGENLLYEDMHKSNWVPKIDGSSTLRGRPLGLLKPREARPVRVPGTGLEVASAPAPLKLDHMDVVASYEYQKITGELSGYVDKSMRRVGVPRSICPQDKSYRPRFQLKDVATGEVAWHHGSASQGTRLLFNLPSLAKFPGATFKVGGPGNERVLTNVVFGYDGEKTTLAGQTLLPGFPHISPQHGRDGWKSADLSPLEGTTLILVPDADDDWKTYIEETRKVLLGKGLKNVWVVAPTREMVALDCGWDVADLETRPLTPPLNLQEWLWTAKPLLEHDWLKDIVTKEDVQANFVVVYKKEKLVIYHIKECFAFEKSAFNSEFENRPDFKLRVAAGAPANARPSINNVGGLSPWKYLTETRTKTLKGLRYYPGCESVYYDEKRNGWFLNTWKPSRVKPIHGNVDIHLWHLCYQFPMIGMTAEESFTAWKEKGDLSLEAFEYLCCHAHMARNPRRKITTVFSWQGKQGTGKSIFEEFYRPLYGESNCSVTSADGLARGQTTAFENKVHVVCEELADYDHKLDMYEKTKPLITNPTLQRHEKYAIEEDFDNHSHIMAITNQEVPIRIQYDIDNERRWFFAKSEALPRSTSYYDGIVAWHEEPLNQSALLNFLLFEFDMKDWVCTQRAPTTASKQFILNQSQKASWRHFKDDIARGFVQKTGTLLPDVCSVRYLKHLLIQGGYIKREGEYDRFILDVKNHLHVCTTLSELQVQVTGERIMRKKYPDEKLDKEKMEAFEEVKTAIEARSGSKGNANCIILRNFDMYHLSAGSKLFNDLNDSDFFKTGVKISSDDAPKPKGGTNDIPF